MTVSYEHRLLFRHEGPLDMEVLPPIVQHLDKLLAQEGVRPPLRRKIISCLIELAQNIIHYAARHDQMVPLITLSRTDEGIVLITRNAVYYSQELFLHSYLQNLTQMSREELEALHHQTLVSGSYSDSGGANLGLLQVIYKADRFEYELTPVEGEYSWFTVKATFLTKSHE
ncbi:MAG: SiaB family protein kinase [Bacteroidia bacterium]|nr:SiaB family protein kinase [Bacteroidia bacterium]GIV23894.1 MAG: hypothetical protein KatS3mg025_1553 [Bacteroidia bacterium]